MKILELHSPIQLWRLALLLPLIVLLLYTYLAAVYVHTSNIALLNMTSPMLHTPLYNIHNVPAMVF